MKRKIFFIIGCGLLTAVIFLCGVCRISAESANARDINAIQERRARRVVTQEEREQAAERLKKSSPESAVKLAEMRAVLKRAAAERIAEIELINDSPVAADIAVREAIIAETDAKKLAGND